MKELKDLKVGDSVYSVLNGELKIIQIHPSDDYQIKTSHGSYTIEGKTIYSDKYPTIYLYPVKVVPVEHKYRVAYLRKGDINHPRISDELYKTLNDFIAIQSPGCEFEWAELIQASKEEV